MSPNPVGVYEFKDGEPVGYTYKNIEDHVLAEWLRRNGWQGDWHKLEEPRKHWNAFVTPKGDVLALVRYKNSQPIDRWAYLKDDLL